MNLPRFACALVLMAVANGAAAGDAGGVIRHKSPGGSALMAQAVEVPANAKTLYFSGMIPMPANTDPKADKNARATWGDTKAQSVNIFSRLKETLTRHGLGLGDVVKMQVFLVGDAELGGKMDFNGFNEAYRQFFGTAEQPQVPARSVMQVAGLANPNWLVEIEVIVVKAGG